MDEEKIILDKETFKALAVDSRINILKLLFSKQHTASEIAETLQMSNSTIKEHLDTLAAAGLIKQEDTDRKWKYYSLTLKGKRVVQPQELKVLVGFCLSALAASVSAVMTVKTFLGNTTSQFSNLSLAAPAPMMAKTAMVEPFAAQASEAVVKEEASGFAMEAADEMMKATDVVGEAAIEQTADAASLAFDAGATEMMAQVDVPQAASLMMQPDAYSVIQPFPWGWLTALVIFAILSGLLLGFYLRKPVMVINSGK